MIRKPIKEDVNSMMDLHIGSFSINHFSAVFSENLLNNYFEKLLSSNKYNYLFVDDNSNKLLGYVLAGYNFKTLVNEFTKENFLQLMWVLITHPKFLKEKLNEIYYRLFGSNYEPRAKCRLYLIATHNEYKGKGIAQKLIAHLEKELLRNGNREYGLSVRKNNLEAIRFYNKNGYIVEFEKSQTIYYYKKINYH